MFRTRLAIGLRMYSSGGSFEHIIMSKPAAGVRLVQLNRPKALNALNSKIMAELNDALRQATVDESIKAVVLTGSEKAFAAGADIKEMSDRSFSNAYTTDFLGSWHQVSRFPKPLIAAVNGFALGGGCELAMMCDIIYAGEKATFGQPEIKLGVIPGVGGTQRLTRAIGKSRAMEIILTGKTFSAKDALEWGLASKVYPADTLVNEAVKTAQLIGSYSGVAVRAAKETVNEAYESGLASGLRFEQRLFYGLFGSADQKEGMKAFTEKRDPKFDDK